MAAHLFRQPERAFRKDIRDEFFHWQHL
jgi:hypothetical protein